MKYKKKFQATPKNLLALDQLQDWFDSEFCMKHRSGPRFAVGPFLFHLWCSAHSGCLANPLPSSQPTSPAADAGAWAGAL